MRNTLSMTGGWRRGRTLGDQGAVRGVAFKHISYVVRFPQMPTEEECRMQEPKLTSNRKCPACASDDYQFRSRKTLPADPQQDAEHWETKYRCKACGKEWKEQGPLK